MTSTWLRSQLTELTTQITGAVAAGKGHRWPLERVDAALRAITDGEEHWQIKGSDALRGGGR